MSFSVDSAKSFAIFVRSSYGDLLMTDPLIKFIKSINPKNKIISREKSKIKLTKTEKRLTVCQDINCDMDAMYGEI